MKKLLLIACCTFSVGAWADCKNPQDAYEIQTCMAENTADLKSELNKVYSKVYKRTQAKNELNNAQKAWLKYRDLQCGTFTAIDTEHSPASTALDLDCQSTLNLQRIDFLKTLLD